MIKSNHLKYLELSFTRLRIVFISIKHYLTKSIFSTDVVREHIRHVPLVLGVENTGV